jgi:ligand-binding sensor domain-containing protein
MEVFNKTNSVFKTNYKFMTVSAAATDKKNVKYFAANSRIYTYDGNNWQVFDSAKVGISDVISITAAPNGNIYIGSFDGLLVHEAGKWELLTTSNSKLPSNHVRYANTDTKGRTWMGTNGGSLMIEKDGKVVALNETKTPLSNLCITDMMEDREGNLWFASYDYKEKRAEKLVKLDNSENWLSYDVHNSGLPGTIINKIISDKHQDVLWLSVQNVGLVRFDKKADWQVYTNQNSGVPSTYIFDMEQDSKGNLWCATFSGLLRVAKKK